MKTIVRFAAGLELLEGRHLTEEEKMEYRPEWHDTLLIKLGESIPLHSLHNWDVPETIWSRPRYSFPGTGNDAWEITNEEWDRFIALDAELAAQKALQKREEEINCLKATICRAEMQQDIPSKAEAIRRRNAYIQTANEGGDGYVPVIIDIDTYNHCIQRLNELTAHCSSENKR